MKVDDVLMTAGILYVVIVGVLMGWVIATGGPFGVWNVVWAFCAGHILRAVMEKKT